MFGMTTGVVLYADPSKEPETILLGGTDSDRVMEIQQYVGGHFDAVKRGCQDESGKHAPFVLVGYVHDEGIPLGMPQNPMASMLFEQNLFGDVVLVNGTNPETGEYDGETYGLPVAFAEYLIRGMFPSVQESVLMSQMLAGAVHVGLAGGAITQQEFDAIRAFMLSKNEEGAVASSIAELPTEIRTIMNKCVDYVVERTNPKDGE
jgi:hypothetical protein